MAESPYGAITIWRNRHMAQPPYFGAIWRWLLAPYFYGAIWRNRHMAIAPSFYGAICAIAIWRQNMTQTPYGAIYSDCAEMAPFAPYGAIFCFCQMENGDAPFLSPSTTFNGARWRKNGAIFAPYGACSYLTLLPRPLCLYNASTIIII